jgi:GNAT superfamily N-acetyltransferase
MQATIPAFPAHDAGLVLRPAQDDDAQDLFGLITLCFAEYPGCFTDPHGDLPDLVRPGHWNERRAADGRLLGGAFLVVEDARGRICASIAIDFPKTDADGRAIGEIHRLYVRPDQRGRGLAKALTRHVERLAEAEGCARMMLWSDTRFTKAHALYEGLGYRRGDTRALGDISNSFEFYFEKAL